MRRVKTFKIIRVIPKPTVQYPHYSIYIAPCWLPCLRTALQCARTATQYASELWEFGHSLVRPTAMAVTYMFHSHYTRTMSVVTEMFLQTPRGRNIIYYKPATAMGKSSRKISAGNEVVVVVEPNVKAPSPAVMTMVIQQKTIIFSKMMALPVTRYYYIICTVWLLHACLLHNMYSMAITHV